MSIPKSSKGAMRQYTAILNRWHREYGGMFGLDWRTMRINCPEDYAYLHDVLKPMLENKPCPV